jgi:hypothetical protein
MKPIPYPNIGGKCAAHTLSTIFNTAFFAEQSTDKDWGFSQMGRFLNQYSEGNYDIETTFADMIRGINFSFKNIQVTIPKGQCLISFAQIEHNKSSHVVAIIATYCEIFYVDTNLKNVQNFSNGQRLPKIYRLAFIVDTVNYQPLIFDKKAFSHLF